MDARQAEMRRWPDRKAKSQRAPQGPRKQGGGLDKNHNEEKQPVQSQRGLQQAPRGLGKRNLHKPPENSLKGKSRIG